MDYVNKQGSKVQRFFEWLFGIVVINMLTITLSLFVVTMFPAFTAAYATIDGFKTNGATRVLKTYFKNFVKYLEKSFLVGIIVVIIFVVCGFSMYFYKTRMEATNPISQAGFWAMLIIMLLVTLFSLHAPLILYNFPKLRVIDVIRTSIFVCFRYILSTLVLLGALVVQIIGFVAFPIWILVGITLPIVAALKLTDATYYYLKKIDLQSIIERSRGIEEGEEDNE